jgi:hypothetical protein
MMYEQQVMNNQMMGMQNNPQIMGIQPGVMYPNDMYDPRRQQFNMQQQPVSMGINTIANAGGVMYPNDMYDPRRQQYNTQFNYR